MKQLTQAIIKAAQSIENIEKTMTVGSGNFSYSGVSDKEVKLIVRKAMFENGLVMIPTKVEPKTTIERWEESYNGNPKQKQQVFTEVVTTYLLMHTSGESMEVQGYGHGVDAQDKAAGKATTYAMKYALLYTFLIATGSIDDADSTHSNELPTPQPKQEDSKPWLNPKDDAWKGAITKGSTLVQLFPYFKISKDNQAEYTKQLNSKK
jgi:hypothetical protein